VAEKLGLKGDQGVRIKDADEAGIGSRMGLKSGDIILEVDGKSISDVSSFNEAVASAKKNGNIRLKVQRGKNQIFLGASMS
jgi:S1-C subfamily serine protease